jgi:oligo-1,6-glucosidase
MAGATMAPNVDNGEIKGGTKHTWWKDGTVYQIYPASFKDSNGDGLGDLPGILEKLEYVASIGVDVLWISPMFDSPQKDMGYDISDYEEVYAPYGTVEDMDRLIQKSHSLGMRVLLDLVVNHTSDQHAWFKESRSSKDNPRRDWYIWRPPRYDKDGNRIAPNNWRGNFSAPAWTYDEHTGEYYLHLFTPEQPDLNWENETCRNAIYDSAMHFWLKKGVDGFRVDTVNMYSKGTDLPDAPIVDPDSFDQPAAAMYCNGPRMHEFLREMNEKVLSKYGAITVGELPNTPDPAHVLRYVSDSDRQLNMVFQFDVVDLGMGRTFKFDHTPHKLSEFKEVVAKWQRFIVGTDGWTTAFCENHDQSRSVSRYASDHPAHRANAAKMLATMMATLTGSLFLYQGQEIGMINAPDHWDIENYKDIDSLNYYHRMAELHQNDAKKMKTVMKGLQALARDHARLPMQWDDSPHAGFTSREATPWMRAHDDYPHINVQQQESDPDSVLNYWRKMIKFRKEHRDLCIYGEFFLYDAKNENTMVFWKHVGEEQAVVVCNFTADEQPFAMPQEFPGKATLAIYSRGDGKAELLKAYEARVYFVKGSGRTAGTQPESDA